MIYVILKYACFLIFIATVVIIGTQIYNARLWITSYPKSIQNAVPKQTKKEKTLKFILSIPFLLALIFMPILAVVEYLNLLNTASFFDVFIIVFGVGFIFNLYDLIILDFLIFSFITPKYQILKGSEHLLHEYKNYKFHFIAFLKGILYGFIISLIIALIIY